MIIKYKYGKNFRTVCKTARSNDSSGARVNIKNSEKNNFEKKRRKKHRKTENKRKKKVRKNPDRFAVSHGKRNRTVSAKMNVTNPIAVHKVNQSPRRCNQEMTTSSYFVSLVSYADPSITHSSSNNSLISKLAYFSMDLYSKLSCRR